MLMRSRGLRAVDPMRWRRPVAFGARLLARPRYTCARRLDCHWLRLASTCTHNGLDRRHHSTSGHGHGHGHGHDHDHEDDHIDPENSISMRFARGESFTSIFLSQMTKKAGMRIGMVGLACAASGLNVLEPVLSTVGITGLPVEPLGAVATVVGGWPVLKHGFADLRARRVTLSLSMSIGILAALGTGESFTSSLMTLVVLISEQLEDLTVQRAHANISTMLDSLPTDVELVGEGGQVQKVAIETVKVGDIVRVRPGGYIPVDGVISHGTGFVNEAQMTGESMPEMKQEGSQVYAGSINQSGVLEVTALAVGNSTVYGQILTTVREAETHRAPVEALADNVAKYVVYFAFLSSALTLAVTNEVQNAVSVLVVAGACGIAAGTPLAIVGGIGKAARRGCVVKGGQHLEMLSKIDTVVFDKTGTLTLGTPHVADAFVVDGAVSWAEFAQILYAVESRSEHPIAHAVAEYALNILAEEGVEVNYSKVSDFQAMAGRGLVGRVGDDEVFVGNRVLMRSAGVSDTELDTLPEDWEHSVHAVHASEVVVVRGGRVLGGLLVRDTVRSEAKATIEALRGMGIRTMIVSGDRAPVVESVGSELGIDETYSHYSPLQKADLVESLVAQGKKVAMVGDGINDAGAMSKASLGIAMGTASALTQQAANVVLLHDTLERIPDAMKISKQARQIIYQNMVGTLVVDVLGSLAAFKGMLPPALAASFHGVWDVVFILNSARLLMPPRADEERSHITHAHTPPHQSPCDGTHHTHAHHQHRSP